MDVRTQLNKHLCNLPCPICKRVAYFDDKGLRSHLEGFHRRVDIESLIKTSKQMCGINEEGKV